MKLNPELLDSPGLYLTGEDNLRLTTFGSLAGAVVVLEGRLVDMDGRTIAVAERHVPNSNYTAASSIIPLAEGILTHVQLRVGTGAGVAGHIFAILEVFRGTNANGQPLGTLLQGYVTTNARLAWPGSPIGASTAGAGRLRSITGTDPAANVQISETVPAGARWRVVLMEMLLTTDANAANRSISLVIDDGVNPLAQVSDNSVQAASLTHTYVAGAWGQIAAFGGSLHALVIPDMLTLPAGSRLRTTVGSFQVGDNWAAPQMLVEEFIEG